MRELGGLLVHLGETYDPEAQARMEHLTIESGQLLGCIKALNPAVYKGVRQGRLDGGHNAAAQGLDAAWFDNLPVSIADHKSTPLLISSAVANAFALAGSSCILQALDCSTTAVQANLPDDRVSPEAYLKLITCYNSGSATKLNDCCVFAQLHGASINPV